MEDLKSKFDRIGDRSLKTWRGKVKAVLLGAAILYFLIVTALLVSKYFDSFHRTTEQVRAEYQFKHLPQVPEWHITFTTNKK